MISGRTYWITGLSGAGKTTLGKLLYERLRTQKNNIIFLDGDALREAFGNDLGYSREDRLACAKRYSKICDLITKQGIDVILCTISMYHEIREWNRTHLSDYIEIYIEVPLDVLKLRNQKNLYLSGKNVAGLDLEIELPKAPDITLFNDGSISPERLINELIKKSSKIDERKGVSFEIWNKS